MRATVVVRPHLDALILSRDEGSVNLTHYLLSAAQRAPAFGVVNTEASGGLVNIPQRREAAAFDMAIAYVGAVLAGALVTAPASAISDLSGD